VPIGDYRKAFEGIFNGLWHTISGIYIDNNNNYQGLFGYVNSGSVISNVGIINSYIRGSWYIGGIVGESEGTIKDCYNKGLISGSDCVGGIAGNNYGGTIENSYNRGLITFAGNYIGDIAGINNGKIIKGEHNKNE
jgi:hypothetical protein